MARGGFFGAAAALAVVVPNDEKNATKTTRPRRDQRTLALCVVRGACQPRAAGFCAQFNKKPIEQPCPKDESTGPNE